MYHARRKTKTVKNVMVEAKRDKIDAGKTEVWFNEKLPIPATPPSYLTGCGIIDIQYYLTVCIRGR